MIKPDPSLHLTLGDAFATVTLWYLDYHGNHVHACLALTNNGLASEQPVEHTAYVQHCDGQRQILATIRPIIEPTRRKPHRWNEVWEVTWEDLREPTFLVTETKNRGCGVARYTKVQAVRAFEEHSAKHHGGQLLQFVDSSPGRTIVRRTLDEGSWVPYGVMLDDRLIRGEKVFPGEPKQDHCFGIDIYG